MLNTTDLLKKQKTFQAIKRRRLTLKADQSFSLYRHHVVNVCYCRGKVKVRRILGSDPSLHCRQPAIYAHNLTQEQFSDVCLFRKNPDNREKEPADCTHSRFVRRAFCLSGVTKLVHIRITSYYGNTKVFCLEVIHQIM